MKRFLFILILTMSATGAQAICLGQTFPATCKDEFKLVTNTGWVCRWVNNRQGTILEGGCNNASITNCQATGGSIRWVTTDRIAGNVYFSCGQLSIHKMFLRGLVSAYGIDTGAGTFGKSYSGGWRDGN